MNENTLKTHYSVYEIAAFKLRSAPQAAKNVQEKAKCEEWVARKRSGRGGGLEYELASMPAEIQAEILALHQVVPREASDGELTSALWQRYENATDEQKEKAKLKFKAVLML